MASYFVAQKGPPMKYNISVNRILRLTIILFICGLISLFVGIRSYYKYNHSLDLESLDEQTLKKGQYVTGNIDTYIGDLMYGSNNFYGVSQTHLTFWKTYDYYTVPFGEDSYIAVLISDESAKEKLAAFEDGHGEKVYFEGIVTEPTSNLNYQWYEKINGFDTKKLVKYYVIKEANLKKTNAALLGTLLLIMSAFLFFASGGSSSVVEVETDKTDYSLYVNLSDKKDKL